MHCAMPALAYRARPDALPACAVAIITELQQVEAYRALLEIETGSGYQAARLAALARSGQSGVYSLEYVEVWFRIKVPDGPVD